MRSELTRFYTFDRFSGCYGFWRAAAVVAALVGGGVMVTGQAPTVDPWKSVAERYVKLVLAVGQHDADYVDAFYGPAEWRKEAEAVKMPLATVDLRRRRLKTACGRHLEQSRKTMPRYGICGGNTSRDNWRRCAPRSRCCRAGR